MERMQFIAAGLVLMLALYGCSGPEETGTPDLSDQDSAGGLAGQPANASAVPAAAAISGYERYGQESFSFDYPEGLSIQESLGSYQSGMGYAYMAFSSKNESEPALIVYYIRFGNSSLLANQSASFIAQSFLESDNKGQDMLGVLHQAGDKSAISLFTTQKGYAAAGMDFIVKDENMTQGIFGYAIQVYDPASTVGMKARILATDSQKANETKERFLDSLEINRVG